MGVSAAESPCNNLYTFACNQDLANRELKALKKKLIDLTQQAKAELARKMGVPSLFDLLVKHLETKNIRISKKLSQDQIDLLMAGDFDALPASKFLEPFRQCEEDKAQLHLNQKCSHLENLRLEMVDLYRKGGTSSAKQRSNELAQEILPVLEIDLSQLNWAKVHLDIQRQFTPAQAAKDLVQSTKTGVQESNVKGLLNIGANASIRKALQCPSVAAPEYITCGWSKK